MRTIDHHECTAFVFVHHETTVGRKKHVDSMQFAVGLLSLPLCTAFASKNVFGDVACSTIAAVYSVKDDQK